MADTATVATRLELPGLCDKTVDVLDGLVSDLRETRGAQMVDETGTALAAVYH